MSEEDKNDKSNQSEPSRKITIPIEAKEGTGMHRVFLWWLLNEGFEELYLGGLEAFKKKCWNGILKNPSFEKSLLDEQKKILDEKKGLSDEERRRHESAFKSFEEGIKKFGLGWQLRDLWMFNYNACQLKKSIEMGRSNWFLKQSMDEKGNLLGEDKGSLEILEKELSKLKKILISEDKNKEELKIKLKGYGGHYEKFWLKYSKKFIGIVGKHIKKNLKRSAKKSFSSEEKEERKAMVAIGKGAVGGFEKDFHHVRRDVLDNLIDDEEHERIKEKIGTWELVKELLRRTWRRLLFIISLLGVAEFLGVADFFKWLWQWLQ